MVAKIQTKDEVQAEMHIHSFNLALRRKKPKIDLVVARLIDALAAKMPDEIIVRSEFAATVEEIKERVQKL